MDKHMDDKTYRAMLTAMNRMVADSQKREAKEEEQLWRKQELPLHLADAVGALTKYDMDRIRQTLDLPGISSLKKAELAEALVELIPRKAKEIFMHLDELWYDTINRIIKNGCFVAPDISNAEVKVLINYGIIFPGTYRGKKALFMPEEIIKVFKQTDGPELVRRIKRNAEWIKLTHGLLYYYGVLDFWRTYKKVTDLDKADERFHEYMKVMNFAEDIYDQVRLTHHGYIDTRVRDVEWVLEEQKKRPGIDYYPFSRDQLLNVFNPKSAYKGKEERALRHFLNEYYEMEAYELDEIILELETMINQDVRPTAMVNFLNEILEFPSMEFVEELTGLLMDFYNHTPQWGLKGYSPAELRKLSGKPVPSFAAENSKSKVVDFEKKVKTGRNDLCPCGSGEKYKKCCGK